MFFDTNHWIQLVDKYVFSQWNTEFDKNSEQVNRKFNCQNEVADFLLAKSKMSSNENLLYSLTNFYCLASYEGLLICEEELIKYNLITDKFKVCCASGAGEYLLFHKDDIYQPVYYYQNYLPELDPIVQMYDDSRCFLITLIELYKMNFYAGKKLFEIESFDRNLENSIHMLYNPKSTFWQDNV